MARNRSALRAAWQARGEHEKAIGYYEPALAGRLEAAGEGHPEVATIRKRAWARLDRRSGSTERPSIISSQP